VSQNDYGINYLWNTFITIAGIAGVTNIVRAVKNKNKDREIELYKKKYRNYQRIIHDTYRKDKLG